MPGTPVREKLRANLGAVEERIVRACQRAGRPRSEVTLVAVTKSVSVDVAALLPEMGIFDLAENRPQELWRKAEALPATVRWHMIGHLQRNKIDRTLPIVSCIHSVDSIRLLRAIDQEAARQDRMTSVFLEINTSQEEAKQGFPMNEFAALPALAGTLKHTRIRGLMTMAALQEPERCRPSFASLRKLRDRLNEQFPGAPFETLSMGMSNDFEVAIEEGATHIRLGTILFEGL